MPDLEKSLKKIFSGKRPILKKTPLCPSELEVGRYLDKALPLSQKDTIEKHLADCGYCLDLVIVAKEALKGARQNAPIAKDIAKQKWFILSMLSLLLSFFVKRYFFQFLTLSLILGIKWCLSPQGSRNLIMIFRNLGRHSSTSQEETPEKVFERK